MDIGTVRKLVENEYQSNTEVADALEELLRRMEGEVEAREGLVVTSYKLENGTPWVYVSDAGEAAFGMPVDDARIAEERRQAHATLMACDEAEKQTKERGDSE